MNLKFFTTNKKKFADKFSSSGYTLLEVIFYISLFVVFSIAIINSLVMMTKAFKETSVYSELAQGGNMIERISREIRNANSIAHIGADTLKLNTKEGASDKTVEFSLSGSDVRFLENDSFVGNLNTPDVSVTALSFSQITTTQGTAVRVVLTVRSNRDGQNRTVDFYDTVVLRGDY